MEKRVAERIETSFTFADGTTRWYLFSIEPVNEGIFVLSLDITERKQADEALRESEARFRQLFAAAQDAIVVVELPSRRFIDVNEAAVRTYGYTLEEFQTLHAEDISAEPEGTRQVLDHVSTSQREPISLRLHKRKDGSTFPVEVVTSILTIKGRKAAFGIIRDVTERRRAEEALVDADRRKNEFLGVLSHELRNPLAPIRNSLYILGRVPSGGEQARRAYAVIDRQVSHLARLVDDLLDITRIASGKVRLQRTRLDLVEVVRRTLDDYRSLLEKHEVTVDLPKEPLWVDGDATRLAQMLGNLLGNAAKFTPNGGKVSVTLHSREGRAVLEVADSGIGIDADTLKRLFEPFAQADRSLDRSSGGLGLGLSLVRGLAELHGGEVSAHSDGPGRGARFTVKLPLVQKAAVTHGDLESRATAGEGRKVLVIEDNQDSADSLCALLEFWGHQVAVAYDGASGLARARDFRPDIILCDLGLPDGLDGYAVARALRQDTVTASTYLVALSGYGQPEDKRRAREAGFDAHLTKPADLQVLERILSQAFAPRTEAGSPSN